MKKKNEETRYRDTLRQREKEALKRKNIYVSRNNALYTLVKWVEREVQLKQMAQVSEELGLPPQTRISPDSEWAVY